VKTFLLRLVLVVLGLAGGLEIGSRLLDRFRGEPFSAETSRQAIEKTARDLSRGAFIPGWPSDAESATGEVAGMRLQPYTGFEHPVVRAAIEADLAYYKTSEAAETFDVCVLGGSVAYLLATVGEKSLVEAFKSDPRLRGRDVRIHNYALGGYKEPQQLMLLSWLLELGQAPDAVIDLDGANEAALGRSNFEGGIHPAYPYLPRWSNVTLGMRSDAEIVEQLHEVHARQERAASFARTFLASGAWRSAFLERVGRQRLEYLRTRYADAHQDLLERLYERPHEPETCGPPVAGGEAGLTRAIVTCWEQSSLAMHGICKEHGIPYLHVLQPTLYDEGSKPLTKKEIAGAKAERGWADGVPQVYPSLREAGKRLAARGVAFFDATGVFRDHPEDLYVDMCHVSERGDEILARAIAPELLAALARR
jgi:hypothetical protein